MVVPRIGLYSRFLIVFFGVRECKAFVLLPNRLSVFCSKRRHGLGLHPIESGFSFSFQVFSNDAKYSSAVGCVTNHLNLVFCPKYSCLGNSSTVRVALLLSWQYALQMWLVWFFG